MILIRLRDWDYSWKEIVKVSLKFLPPKSSSSILPVNRILKEWLESDPAFETGLEFFKIKRIKKKDK